MYSNVKGNTLAGNKNNKSTPLSLSMEKALADGTHDVNAIKALHPFMT